MLSFRIMSSSKRKCYLIDVQHLYLYWLQYLTKVGSVTAASLPSVFFLPFLPHLHHASGSAVSNLYLPLLLDGLWWFFQLLTTRVMPSDWLHLLLSPIHTRVCCQPASCVFLLLATVTTRPNQRRHLNPGFWMILCQIIVCFRTTHSSTLSFACLPDCTCLILPLSLLPGEPACLLSLFFR